MSMAVTTGQAGIRRSVAAWWRGRYGAQLAFEVALCGALLVIYRAIRTLTKSDLRAAFANTRDIIALESWLGLPFEDNLQQWLLDHPAFIKALNHYYIWFHFPAAIGLLLWLYLRHPNRYRGFRNLMAFVTFTALIIHLVFPLAPPRMMTGFVDTMREFGPSIYPKNALDGAANQIAAMPSLHFGWAMIEAIAVISVLQSRWRWLVVVHPVVMTLAIIATGNHWWIDAAAAALIIISAVMVWRMVAQWGGDRTWSWTAMRFQSYDDIAKLEALANAPIPTGNPVELDQRA
jgi:PAP2 superfamily